MLNRIVEGEAVKKCFRCNEVKPIKEFPQDPQNKDGLFSWCRSCKRSRAAYYRKLRSDEKAKTRIEKDKTKKTCTKCKDVKPIEEFYQLKKSGYRHSKCRTCKNEEAQKWHAENGEKRRATAKKYREANKGKVRGWRKKTRLRHPEKSMERTKKWRAKNPEKYKAAVRRRNMKKRSTPKGKINQRISAGIKHALRERKAGRHWESLVGYTVHDLKVHLEKQFKKHPGMNWERFMAGDIHIDHKIPIAAFHFETHHDIDFQRCWALKNLQPLWKVDNIKKSDHVNAPFQPSLYIAIGHGDCPGGVLDRRSDIEVEDAGKGQKMFKCFEGEKGRE